MSVDTAISWVLEELARQFAAVVSTMTGAEAEARRDTDISAPAEGSVSAEGSAAAEGSATAEADRILWVQPFDLAEGTSVALAAPRETWRMIGAKPLEAAGLGPDEIDDESARSTFLEILNQTMGALGSQVGAKVNRQVLPQNGQEAQAWPTGFTGQPFQLTMTDTFPLGFRLAASVGWESALTPGPAAGSGESGALTAGAGPGGDSRGAHGAASHGGADTGALLAQHSRTFDLLLEVELPVSISFGRALVPLREVAKLTSGSVVELNRTVSDPVEIIVNNCVIARGEVVVIEGNYGVRIQQIISPQERLRTLN